MFVLKDLSRVWFLTAELVRRLHPQISLSADQIKYSRMLEVDLVVVLVPAVVPAVAPAVEILVDVFVVKDLRKKVQEMGAVIVLEDLP